MYFRDDSLIFPEDFEYLAIERGDVVEVCDIEIVSSGDPSLGLAPTEQWRCYRVCGFVQERGIAEVKTSAIPAQEGGYTLLVSAKRGKHYYGYYEDFRYEELSESTRIRYDGRSYKIEFTEPAYYRGRIIFYKCQLNRESS